MIDHGFVLIDAVVVRRLRLFLTSAAAAVQTAKDNQHKQYECANGDASDCATADTSWNDCRCRDDWRVAILAPDCNIGCIEVELNGRVTEEWCSKNGKIVTSICLVSLCDHASAVYIIHILQVHTGHNNDRSVFLSVKEYVCHGVSNVIAAGGCLAIGDFLKGLTEADETKGIKISQKTGVSFGWNCNVRELKSQNRGRKICGLRGNVAVSK